MATSFRTIAVTFAAIGIYCLLVSFGPSLVFRQSASVETEVATSSRLTVRDASHVAARIDGLQAVR